ncbi:MAG: CinA family protein [Patescibacteria group bacterium]
MQKKEKVNSTSRSIANIHPMTRTEGIVELLAKEKEPFIKRGSIDTLAKYAVDVLRNYGINHEGLKINIMESLSTSGKISDALTNNSGITSIFSYGLIVPNDHSIQSAFGHEMIGTQGAFGLNSREAAAIFAARNNALRPEDISLVSTGGMLEKGNDVHISIMTKRIFRQDGSSPPHVLTINIADFEKEVENHPEYLKGATLNSLKKQYVAHRALLFLLQEVKARIEDKDLLFKPRQTKEDLFIYRTRLMKYVVDKMIKKGFKLGIAESATGGRLVDAITDIEKGHLILGKCAVLYNEKEKRAAGVAAKHLTEDAVYSKETAEALADTAAVNLENPHTEVQIGFTGLFTRLDHRTPRTERHKLGDIFHAINVKGKKVHSKFINLPRRTKLEMKEMSTIIVYRHLLQILNEKFSSRHDYV